MNKGLALPILAIIGLLYLSVQTSPNSNVREKLSPIINSEHQEVRPLISDDGKTLYFSRRHHPENLGGTADFQDVWMSHLLNGKWSNPTNLGGPVNNKKANTLCSISPDGKFALFLDSYKSVKTPLGSSVLTSNGWRKPKALEIKDFINLSSYYDFHYHETKGVLLMAINTGRGSGDQDLHVSFLQDDQSYSKPVNLGRVVNSRKADFAPFLAADSKTLFYASYGHTGQGGSDLYVTTRLDDSWRKWSRPINLGPVINSEDDENYLSVTGDMKYVYFESYPKGSTVKDIYRAPLDIEKLLSPQQSAEELIAEDLQETEQLVNINEISEGDETNPALASEDDLDKNLDVAPLDVPSTVTTKVESATSQVTAVAKPPSSNSPMTTTAEANSSGNLRLRESLNAGQIQSKVLNNLYFPYNSHQLSSGFQAKLKEIAGIMKDRTAMEARIEGHTDNIGSNVVNLRISYLRAQGAAHYLVDKGISSGRLQIHGSGEGRPIASNDDEREGRELNRRVEITLTDAAGAQLVFVLY